MVFRGRCANFAVAAAVVCGSVACQPEQVTSFSGSIDQENNCPADSTLVPNKAGRVIAIFGVDVQAHKDEWDELEQLLQSFADTHGLSMRNSSRTQPGVVDILEIRLCARGQPTIQIVEQRWASSNYLPPIKDRGVGIYFYGDTPEDVWHQSAAEVVAALEARWPNGVRFIHATGNWVDRPTFLPARPSQ